MISPIQHRPIELEWRIPTSPVLAPTVEPVTIADYTAYKRQAVPEHDTVIWDKLRSARRAVELYSRKTLVYQQWDTFLELAPGAQPFYGITTGIFARWMGFNPQGREIPKAPLIRLNGIFVSNEGGTEVQVDVNSYWVSRANDPGRFAQRVEAVWPDTDGRTFETCRVNFDCGYLVPFAAQGASSAVLNAPGHNYAIGSALQVTNRDGALPAPLSVNANYFVVASDTTAGTLQVSATKGGSPIVMTDTGTGIQFLGVLPDNLRRALLELAINDSFTSQRKSKKEGNEQTLDLPALAKGYLDEYRPYRI